MTTEKKENKLKAIAGLIQGLSFREMTKLSHMLAESMVCNQGCTHALLETSDKILAMPEEGR